MSGQVELQELAVASEARDTRLDRARAVATEAQVLCRLAQGRAERVLGTAAMLARLLRCQGDAVREAMEQRDRARNFAVGYEQELAAVRLLHQPVLWTYTTGVQRHVCKECTEEGYFTAWPCATAALVYLPDEREPQQAQVAS